MSNIMLLIIFVIGAILLGSASSISYEGHKVYKVVPQDESLLRFLHELYTLDENRNYNILSRSATLGRPLQIMVSPEQQEYFEDYLNLNETPFETLKEDVENTIQAEREYHANLEAPSGRITFDRYYTHTQINQYVDDLAANYSNIVTVTSIGQSYEKRNMKALRITNPNNNQTKSVILVDAGIHAREWIAPAVALYLIQQLVQNKTNSNYLDKIEWVIIPSLNPDGYDYTWTKDRLWRKTRSPTSDNKCFGVDANRNFGFQWGKSGASNRACDTTFAGAQAFSEVETQHFRYYVLKLSNVKAYITLHSAGSYFLWPYGYALNASAPNAKELDLLGRAMAAAITKVHGTKYIVGNPAKTLYATAGASQDWVMAVANVSLVYSVELPEGGDTDFDPPPKDINPIVTETFEAFRVLHDYVVKSG